MKTKIYAMILSLTTVCAWAIDPDVTLKVWTNEAIINVYSFSDKTWNSRQQDMAAYFLPSAWETYLKAINESNILKLVKKDHMTVSAVATLPPSIKAIHPNTYQAHMPILVEYKGEKDTQKQYLSIDLEIVKTPTTTSRGYAINRFSATIDSNPCQCADNSSKTKVTIV